MDENRSDYVGGLGRAIAAVVALIGLVAAKSCIVAGHHVDDIGRALTCGVENAPIEAGADDAWRGTRSAVGGAIDQGDNAAASSAEQQAAEKGGSGVASGLVRRAGDGAADLAGDVAQEVVENQIQDALEDEEEGR